MQFFEAVKKKLKKKSLIGKNSLNDKGKSSTVFLYLTSWLRYQGLFDMHTTPCIRHTA